MFLACVVGRWFAMTNSPVVNVVVWWHGGVVVWWLVVVWIWCGISVVVWQPKGSQKEVKQEAREMEKLQKYEIVNC